MDTRTPPAPPSIAILTAMTALGTLALNLFLPSMPGLAVHLGTDVGTMQLTLTLYLVGWAAGQLVCGPLSDRYGRRPVLLAGIAVYVAGSLLCAAAWSVGALIAGRLVQALGASAGFVISSAIVQDAHGRSESARVLAWISVAMAVVPAVVPVVGGMLDEWLSWRAGFLLVVAVGVIAFAACAGMPETRPAGRRRLRPLATARAVAALLRSPVYGGFTLNFVLTNAAYYAFLGAAPYVAIELLGLSPSAYGLWFAAIPAGYLLGSLIAARLSSRVGVERMVLAGTALALAGAAALAVLAGSIALSPLVLFAPMSLVALGNGIGHPSAIAGAVSADPDLAGAAAGIKGFLQMSVGAGTTWLVGGMLDGGAWPAAVVIAAALVGALAAFAVASAGTRAAGVPAVVSA